MTNATATEPGQQLTLDLPTYRTKAEIVAAVHAVMEQRQEVAKRRTAELEAQEAMESTRAYRKYATAKGDTKAAVRELLAMERLLPDGVWRAEHPGEPIPGQELEDQDKPDPSLDPTLDD